MGQFQSGVWLIVLSIFIFLHFLIVYSVSGALVHYNISSDGIEANDVGFGSGVNACYGNSMEKYCFNTGISYFESGCESVSGCTWYNATFSNPCIDQGCCEGLINYSRCSEINDSDVCEVVGCAWDDDTDSNFADPNKKASSTKVSETFKVMYGFSSTVNIPSKWYFIYTFFFSWLPTIMLLFALYMLLPFLH